VPGETLFLALVRVRQQVVRGNQNLAATLYESALLSDARAARKTAHILHKTELSMQVEATTRVDRILRFRSISGACLWIRARSSLQTRPCSCTLDGRLKAFIYTLTLTLLPLQKPGPWAEMCTR
jgi:hypothetical protein